MLILPPVVTSSTFADLDASDEAELLRRCAGHVRKWHDYLNRLPCLSDIQRVRRRWKARVANADAFGNLATEPHHWYTFHHGGRVEAQFNVGLHTTHLRVGMGFEFTMKKGGDPTIVQLSYACFVDQIRRDLPAFEKFARDNRLEGELVDNAKPGLQTVPSGELVRWLLNPAREPQWLFVGRLLRRNADSTMLEDPNRLGQIVEAVMSGFRPRWESVQSAASAMR